MLAAETARALALQSYTDRPSAIGARNQIAAMANTVLPFYGVLGADACDAFDEIYGSAAQFLSQKIINLAPVELVSLAVSLPSNVLAYRLYGDPNRGLQLAQMNNVATPCFMPTLFEAPTS